MFCASDIELNRKLRPRPVRCLASQLRSQLVSLNEPAESIRQSRRIAAFKQETGFPIGD
jgi:hypothetical protein